MIDFKTIRAGDKVRVIGAGAPGFAALGETLEITRVEDRRVFRVQAEALLKSLGKSYLIKRTLREAV